MKGAPPDEVARLRLELSEAHAALKAETAARHRAEQAWRNSELNATALIEGIPGLVAVLGPDGEVQRVNRQIEEYCGQTLDELRHWGSNGTVHPEDMPHVAEIFGASIASGSAYVIEQRLRRFDGEYRWFDNRGRPLRDESGAVVAWHVLLTDVDDRKRAEEALRASERELRQQIDAIPAYVWSARPDGAVDFYNRGYLDYLGVAAEEIQGWDWDSVIHPDDREGLTRTWTNALRTLEPYEVQMRVRRFDGSYRWCLSRTSFLEGADGEVKWFGVSIDIDDMKRAQEDLRESELNLRRLTETIPQNLFGAGADGSVNYLNPQMRDWFGRAEETIMAEEWVHLVHPDDRDATVEAWMRAVAAGTPYRHQVRFLHHSGEYRWCIGEARPLRLGNGAIIAWHGVVNDIHDRKLAEDALKASEQNLRLTIDTIPALAWSARADGSADFFNRHYLDYVGLSVDDLSDWQWMRVIHPDDLEAVSDSWERFSATGAGGEVEARVRRHDGVYRWFTFRTQPLRDGRGNVVKWYGVKVDIDEQKRATLMLAGERQLLELIAAGRPLLEVLGALCGVVETALSESHCEVRTIDVNDTVFEHIVTPSLPASFTAGLAGTHLSAEASPWDVAVAQKARVVVRDIRCDPRWADAPVRQRFTDHGLTSAWIVPVSSRDGRVLGSVSVYHRQPMEPQPYHQDILDRTIQIASIAIERWRAEDELRRREYLLGTAETISETGWFYWDLNNNKLVWSPQMYRIWGLDEGIDPQSVDLLSQVHPDDRPGVEERIAKIFNGEDIPEREERYFMPDGRMKYVRGSTLIFRYEDGRRECIGVAQDITRRRVAEDALDKLRLDLAHITRVTSLGELAASIAHEVNQPLSGIITNANTGLRMLTTDPPDIEGAIKTAQRSLRDGNRASEVIQRLRGLFRKQDFTPEPLDLNEAAREVIAICSHDMQRRRIALTLNLDPALPLVVGDRIQLQQVILNLVLNAADALGSTQRHPRQIFIETAEAAPGTVQLAIRDTGSGISAEDLGRIFDAFYTTKPAGMGIGLSVSKSILDRHDGKLWASRNDGPGATFTFSIPCAPDGGGPSTATPPRPSEEQDR